MAVEVVKRLAVKQTWISRRVVGGRRRRRRTGGDGLLFGLLGERRLSGEPIKNGKGQKNAQNGIRTKNISTIISAGFKKKN